MDFLDKVIWITGASSGIGEYLAYAFASRGAKLILSARNEDGLKEVKQAIGDKATVKILPLDVSDHESLRDKTQEALQAFDGIDILVNNAGISQRSAVEDTMLSIDKRIFDVNFFGNIGLTKELLPHFLDKKSGRIVVISSITGKLATPFRSAYAASKHALHGWYDALRAEVEDRGIQVHIACPGYVRTRISYNALKGDGKEHGVLDDNQAAGLGADKCAERIIGAIEKNKKEVLIGSEAWFVKIRKMFPGLYYKIIRNMARNKAF